jgi:hypothetical protein
VAARSHWRTYRADLAVIGCYVAGALLVTGRLWRDPGNPRSAAVVGGVCCGFGPGMLAQATGHPHIACQFLLPFIVLCVLRLRGPGPVLRPALVLAALVVGQVFLGEEALLLTAVALGLFIVVYAGMRPAEVRGALRRGAAVLGPWLLLAHTPLTDSVIPTRFALVAWTAAALLTALFVDRAPAPRWAVAAAVAAALVPLAPTPMPTTAARPPSSCPPTTRPPPRSAPRPTGCTGRAGGSATSGSGGRPGEDRLNRPAAVPAHGGQ